MKIGGPLFAWGGGDSLLFNDFFSLRAHSFARALYGMNAISLSFHKEMAKEKEPKGLMPFGNPEREKSFRCRSTHFFAKVSIFRFCVGVFNKNANTKDARKQNGKSFCHLRRTPVQLTFLQKCFCFLRLPRVVATLEAQHLSVICDLSCCSM
jgi:hypothetical protein